MLLIDDVLVSEDVFEEQFHCDLEKCLGACCWEGDFGAPLSEEEIRLIKTILPGVRKILPEENRQILSKKGPSELYQEADVVGTALMPDLSCVFLVREGNHPGRCAFEILYDQGLIGFKKPISCELYPIRLLENEAVNFTAINYDRWDICAAACILGRQKKLPVFRFLKNGLIRKFGVGFYEQLEAYFSYNHPEVSGETT